MPSVSVVLSSQGVPTLARKLVHLVPGETRNVVLDVGLREEESVRLSGLIVGPDLGTEVIYVAKLNVQSNSGGRFKSEVLVDKNMQFDFGRVPIGSGVINVFCRTNSASGTDSFVANVSVTLIKGQDLETQIDVPGVSMVLFDTHQANTLIGIESAIVQYVSLDTKGFGGTKLHQDGKPLLLPAGRYMAVATANAHSAIFARFEIQPHESATIVPFALAPAEPVATTFLGKGGSPLGEHMILVTEIDGVPIPMPIAPSFKTNGEGIAPMGVLPRGVYSLNLLDKDFKQVFSGEIDFRTPLDSVSLQTE